MIIYLSPKHGVNPSLTQCFFCGEASGVALCGRLPSDAEAPYMMCIDREPCSECKEHMARGVILVSVQDAATDKMYRHWRCQQCGTREEVALRLDENAKKIPAGPLCDSRRCRVLGQLCMTHKYVGPTDNPCRTGGWVVVAEKFIKRVIHPPELVEHMLQTRFAFVPDEAWNKLGLPYGKTEEDNERQRDEEIPGSDTCSVE